MCHINTHFIRMRRIMLASSANKSQATTFRVVFGHPIAQQMHANQCPYFRCVSSLSVHHFTCLRYNNQNCNDKVPSIVGICFDTTVVNDNKRPTIHKMLYTRSAKYYNVVIELKTLIQFKMQQREKNSI